MDGETAFRRERHSDGSWKPFSAMVRRRENLIGHGAAGLDDVHHRADHGRMRLSGKLKSTADHRIHHSRGQRLNLR